MSFCKFQDCPKSNTSRACSQCNGIAHHLCSNMYLFDKGIELSGESKQFCSSTCADMYIFEDKDMNSRIDKLESWNVDDVEDDADDKCSEKELELEEKRGLHVLRNSYTIKEKQRILLYMEKFQNAHEGYLAVQKHFKFVPINTLKKWKMNKDNILKVNNIKGKRQKSIGRVGRNLSVPFTSDVVMFMKDARRQEHPLTVRCVLEYVKTQYPEFISNYMEHHKQPYKSLLQLFRRIAYRHGLKQRRSHQSKLSTTEKSKLRISFIEKFQEQYGKISQNCLFNIDETAIWFDPVPHTILAFPKSGQTTIKGIKKHTGRITAVLAITASGRKLPILFILPGTRNGRIAQQELKTYPKTHYYICQPNAWMEQSIWSWYIENVLRFEIQDPSVLLVDNLDCHISQTSVNIVAESLGSEVVPLPENCTSVCQPLDVGVMGPLKKKIQTLWLSESSKKSAAEKRKLAIQLTIRAFESISTETIQRSWQKSILP